MLLCKVNDFVEIFEIKAHYTMKNTLRNTFLFMALFFLAFSINSCYKKKDTIANVTVMNSNDEAVSGVEVRLFYAVSGDSARIDETSTTGGGGTATFNFNELYQSGQAGFAVLDIYVQGVIVGIIKIEEEKTTAETIIL